MRKRLATLAVALVGVTGLMLGSTALPAYASPVTHGQVCNPYEGSSGTHGVQICAYVVTDNAPAVVWSRLEFNKLGTDTMPYEINYNNSEQWSRDGSSNNYCGSSYPVCDGITTWNAGGIINPTDGYKDNANHLGSAHTECKVHTEGTGEIYFTQAQLNNHIFTSFDFNSGEYSVAPDCQ